MLGSRSKYAFAHLAILGFVSGLPLALSGGTLEMWAVTSGFDLTTIGWLGLAGFAPLFKPLWAPAIDAYPLFGFRRRGWLRLSALAMSLSIAALAASSNSRSAGTMAACVVAMAFFSATFDVALGGWQAERFSGRLRGSSIAVVVWAFRLAMLVSGAVAVIAADRFGWQLVFASLALLVLLGCLPICWLPDLNNRSHEANDSARHVSREVIRDLLNMPKVWLFIIFIVSFKLPDSLLQALVNTMLIRELGFSLSDIGLIQKSWALAAGLIGALLGAWLLKLLSLRIVLLWTIVCQALTNLGYLWLLVMGEVNRPALILVVTLEQTAGSIANCALLALIMTLTNLRFAASGFALWSAMTLVPRTFCSPVAAYGVNALGWESYIPWTMLPALLSVMLLAKLRRHAIFLERTLPLRSSETL